MESVSVWGKDDIFALTAAAEQFSEHPLGKAIVKCYGRKPQAAEEFRMVPGEGVTAKVDGKRIKAGNLKMIAGNEAISFPSSLVSGTGRYLDEGSTVIYVAVDDVLAGYIVLSDTVREESAAMIEALGQLGAEPVLLTGDNQNAASAIARQLHIEKVHANCLPEDKLRWISAYQEKKEAVCMIGDGVNDAPALKMADVGIAMGGVGSDIAVDAADIALVDDEVKELPHLLALSKRMMATIKWNLTFSMALNFLAVTLAITSILNPVIGALVHNAGSVFVIINSSLLLGWKVGA